MKPKVKQDMTKLILSPMPGSVVSINVKPGDTVAEGGEVAVVEAMKMQNILHSPRVGKVKKVHVQAGQSVSADEVIIELE
jgi:propionyl-CoA carboxylase alpha chain